MTVSTIIVSEYFHCPKNLLCFAHSFLIFKDKILKRPRKITIRVIQPENGNSYLGPALVISCPVVLIEP